MAEKNKKCLYCGSSFTERPKETGRKYCSRQCASKATYNRRQPNSLQIVWAHDKSVFDTAMEMYWEGEGGSAIARLLDIPIGTMNSWVHDFGNRRQRKEPLKKLLQGAKKAEEWLAALRENTTEENGSFDDLPYYLVCGTVHGQSVAKFTGIIYECLQCNPMSGSVYAFCNKTRTAITTFAWKSPVYQITKNVKMHGTFIWPHEDLGKAIEVTRAEFNRLLFLNKQEIIAEKTAKSLVISRV